MPGPKVIIGFDGEGSGEVIGIPGMPGPKVIIGIWGGDWNTRNAWTKGNYWLLGR